MIIFIHHKNLTSFNPVLTIVMHYHFKDQLKFEDIEQIGVISSINLKQ